MDKALYEAGLEVRKATLGKEFVENAIASADDFNRPLQEFVTEYCWGACWTRPGLPRKTRSMLNLAMLTALNRPHELKMHLKGALTNGVTREEIREILLQTGVYCGVPAAVDAFRTAKEVFAELDKKVMAKERLGFIGVGRMGDPMARNLLNAGFELTIYDTSAAAIEPLKALGAQVANSPTEVANAAEVVLVSLPTPDIVKKVAIEAATGSRVKIFIDVSTTGPKVAAEVATILGGKGITAVDAPVTGGVGGAKKGTLAVMLACPRDLVERVRPVLEPIGKVFFLGERPGSGQLMKLANNLLSAAALAVTSEVMVMGVKGGLDPQVMLDVINSGTGRNSASVDKFPRAILPRTFDFGFAIGLLLKDVKLCTDEAAGLGVPMICGNAIRELLAITALRQGADADFTTIVKTVEEWAGVEVKG